MCSHYPIGKLNKDSSVLTKRHIHILLQDQSYIFSSTLLKSVKVKVGKYSILNHNDVEKFSTLLLCEKNTRTDSCKTKTRNNPISKELRMTRIKVGNTKYPDAII